MGHESSRSFWSPGEHLTFVFVYYSQFFVFWQSENRARTASQKRHRANSVENHVRHVMNQVSTLVVLKDGMPESCGTFFFRIVLEQWGVSEEKKNNADVMICRCQVRARRSDIASCKYERISGDLPVSKSQPLTWLSGSESAAPVQSFSKSNDFCLSGIPN